MVKRRLQLARAAMAVVALLAVLAACDTSEDALEEDSWLSEQRPNWLHMAATVTPASQATSTLPHSPFNSVSVGGSDNVCGLRTDGSLYCRSSWITAPDGPFALVSATDDQICAVKEDGSLACWGRALDGQATPPGGAFASVSLAHSHACGVRADGYLTCWGDDEHGQATPPQGAFTSVSAGVRHSCGVRADGSITCWGDDEHGQATPPQGAFTSVSAGLHHSCGVRADGSIACWGDDEHGQTTPPQGAFTLVSIGWSVGCGVREDKTLACWHLEEYPYSSLSEPDNPPQGTFISVSLDGDSACAVREDGSVDCWGYVPPPPAMADLSIIGRTSNSLTIKRVEPPWSPDIEPPADYYYELHASRSPEGPYRLVIPGLDAETYVVDDLQPSAVYYLALLVCDEFGCSQVAVVATTESDGPVSAPSTPTGFRGEKIVLSDRGDDARLTWDAVEGATYYELWRGSYTDAPFKLLVQISAPLEAQSFHSAPNRGFFGEYSLTSWKVRACNKAGCSLFTDIVTIE